MEKMRFSVEIHVPREKVWNVLWEDATFREWTRVFDPESHAVGDWKEGGSIRFIGSHGHGMYAVIDKLVQNEYISFKHLGELKDGKEAPYNEPVLENYTLKESEDATSLTVEMDVIEKYKALFEKQFPEALSKVKELAENR